jgi:DNA-binding MarR family transcriptional regulator
MILGLSGAVLATLARHPKTAQQLADALGATRASVHVTLQRHRLVGRVSRQKFVTSGRTFLYSITESGKKKLAWIEKSGGLDGGDPSIGGLFRFMQRSVSKYLDAAANVPMSNPGKFNLNPGIYFLYKAGKLFYIGKSDKSLFERISDQAESSKRPFTVRHLPIDKDFDGVSMRRVEDWLILAFRPPGNGNGVQW